MNENLTTYWLWLVMVLGVGSVRTLELFKNADNAKELYYSMHDPDCGLLQEKERERVRKTSLEQAKAILAFCEKNGIGIMTWEDEIYPDSLREIYNPPCVLFYRGDPSLLHHGLMLTAVGTRHPSPYSLKVAQRLGTDLARCNMILVSGCAVGLDAAIHRAALDAGSPTIAVLGCGVDYDYPQENRALKTEIEKNGLLLTEYFPGTPPRPRNFPVRNRILAGISEATLIIEASETSGSLITANLACEQGKSVFCVPPADIFDKRYSGVMNFLRDGAYPVFNHMDVVYAFYLKYPHKLSLYDETDSSRTLDSLVFDEPKEPKPARHQKQRLSVQIPDTLDPERLPMPARPGEYTEDAPAAQSAEPRPAQKRHRLYPEPPQAPARQSTAIQKEPAAPAAEPHPAPTQDAPGSGQPRILVCPDEATEVQRQILLILQGGPKSLTEISRRLHMDVMVTAENLLDMLMLDWIENKISDIYSLPE